VGDLGDARLDKLQILLGGDFGMVFAQVGGDLAARVEAVHEGQPDVIPIGASQVMDLADDQIEKGVIPLGLQQRFGPIQAHGRAEASIQLQDQCLGEQRRDEGPILQVVEARDLGGVQGLDFVLTDYGGLVERRLEIAPKGADGGLRLAHRAHLFSERLEPGLAHCEAGGGV
jgi:hypothetical protein